MIFDSTIFYIQPTKFVVPLPYNEGKYLIFSSCFFIIPCIYGFINNQYFYATTSLLTSIFSVNHWKNPTYSYRRVCDVIMARISFTIYIVSGCYYTNVNGHFIITFTGYSLLLLLLYFYYMSIISSNDKNYIINKKWYKYHMAFHFTISSVMILVIKSVIDYEKYLIR